MTQVLLVTGASSGIGRAVAQAFAVRGWRVFGTDPRDAAAASGASVRGLVLDVCDHASAADAIAAVLREAGRIDVLVNNAGIAAIGPLEEMSAEQARAVFDVNLFGAMRVTNAVLRAMRERSAGRIINMSSLSAVLPSPYLGVYAASKHALEGYSEALASEVGQFGIRVSLVEPGFVRTAIGSGAIDGSGRIADYDAVRGRAQSGIRRAVAEGGDAVWRAATAQHPRLRYPVGRGAAFVRLLRPLPHSVLAWHMRRQIHLESFKPLALLRKGQRADRQARMGKCAQDT
jgi:NAD(P)-dependent dehydrogenase (short-subunit alcohol dehydrogenase family)